MIKVNGYEVEFQKFPNGETRVIQESILNALHKGEESFVDVVLKYEDDSDLIKLMFVKRYLDNSLASNDRIELNIYYMMYSRMDRIENDSAFTLKYVADFINYLDFSKVTVNEPHSDVTAKLINNVSEKFLTPIIVKKVMEEFSFDENDSLMFPDNGAKQRYEKSIHAENIIVGEKERDFETGRIKSLKLVGDLDGKSYRVLICDDLSSYGGTFIKSANELRKKGFDWIGLVVTHSENVIFDGELFNHIDALFTTDSILSNNERILELGEEKLRIYKVDDLLDEDSDKRQ